MERCDGYDGGIRRCGRCDSCQKCDSPKEVCQLVERCDGHGKK